jgi:cysteinyl-tRNA synthetase
VAKPLVSVIVSRSRGQTKFGFFSKKVKQHMQNDVKCPYVIRSILSLKTCHEQQKQQQQSTTANIMMLKISHQVIAKLATTRPPPNNNNVDDDAVGASAIFKLLQARPALLEKAYLKRPTTPADTAVKCCCYCLLLLLLHVSQHQQVRSACKGKKVHK